MAESWSLVCLMGILLGCLSLNRCLGFIEILRGMGNNISLLHNVASPKES